MPKQNVAVFSVFFCPGSSQKQQHVGNRNRKQQPPLEHLSRTNPARIEGYNLYYSRLSLSNKRGSTGKGGRGVRIGK